MIEGILRDFNDKAFETVRNIMGHDTHVFMGDMFNATTWNDGWWTDAEHTNTYLDSHYYHGTNPSLCFFIYSLFLPASNHFLFFIE